jgi:alpha-2-macroglobulin
MMIPNRQSLRMTAVKEAEMTTTTRPQSGSRTRDWLILALTAVVIIGGIVGGALELRSGTAPVAAAPASILGWEPGIQQGVPLNGPLTVYFSRAMDRPSVERTWRLSPAAAGTFTWSAMSVTFHPSRPLRAGTYYHLSIGTGARDDQQKSVQNPLSVAFTTGNALAVQNIIPARNTTGVPANSLIAITFNHPMVALTGLDASPPAPSGWHITISPPTAGHGSWLGTSTWVFHPASGLLPSSDYTVTLPGTIRDAAGDPLGQGLSWTFHTAIPAVVDRSPRNNQRDANPNGTVSVAFNQAMDAASTASAFALQAAGTAVKGSISWQGNKLVFHPATALDPARTYTAAVAGSARSANRAATLGSAVTWRFGVAPPPRVVSSTPAPGVSAANPYVELHFSAPMVGASLDRHLTIVPAVSSLSTYVYGADGRGSNVYSINGNFQPSTTYTVTVAAGARDTFGRLLAAPYTLSFRTAPLTPSATLYGANGAGQGITFTAGRVVNAPVQFVNVPRARYVLVRSDLAAMGNSGGFGGPLSIPAGTTIRDWSAPVPSPLNKVQNMDVPLANPDGSPLAPGLYWLGVQGPASGNITPSSSEFIAASNASVTMKTASGQTLVWVTSARTGAPLSGVTVQLIDNNGKTIATGTTDTSGLHLFHVANDGNVQAAVVEGAYFGMALNFWQPDVQNSYPGFGGGIQYKAPPTGTYVYTDRPIYRPGQIVHFRGVVWQDRDGVYSPYKGTAVTAHVTDGAGHAVYRAHLVPDALGSVHGDFRLPSKAATGYAYLSIDLLQSAPGSTGTPFSIAAYRKPEFLTTVSADRASYAQGQTMTATVQVRYVFGAAVAGQHVDWTAYSQNQVAQPPVWDAYQFGDQSAIQQMYMNQTGPPGLGQGPFGPQIAQGSGTTDDQGRLVVHLPIDLAKQAMDQTVTVEATTTDINHQSITGRVQVPAYKAKELIGLSAGQQVIPASTRETIDVVSVRDAGSPIASATLTASVYLRTYTSELGNNSFAGSLWRQVPHDTLVSHQSLTTDAHGKASVSFTPTQGGEYYVAVTGKDDLGNTARSGIFVYASAAGFSDWGASANTAISLQPDRSTYRVGQTAHILIAAPFADATALITVERGSIRSHRVMHLRSNSPTIDVPISLDDIPNIYVTATLYRGQRNGSPPDWRYGLTELHVKVDRKRLVVHLAQNRSHYHPGDPVTYTVTTTDVRGRPVSAQLSLALVDTAVLALQDEQNPDIVQALYGERPLGVGTMSGGVVSIDHLQQHAGFRVVPGGGGGGGGGGQGISTIYRHFRDTAYWSANVITNSSGHASIHLTLPDNFTTWHLDARGITTQQQVGQAHLLTLATQDMVLRPVAPRFLLQGDTLKVGVVVNDDLNKPITADLSLAASGLTVRAGTRRITVPAHGEHLVLWPVDVPLSTAAQLTFSAKTSTAGVQGYGIQIRLPVHPPLTDETVVTSGQVFGSARQTIVVPSAALSQPGALTVQVSSALTAGMGKALPDFKAQPYESNDDVADRLIAADALHSIPATVSGLPAATFNRLRGVASAAAAKLAGNQLADGGWPWFSGPGATSDVGITADVVQALGPNGSGQPTALAKGRAYLQVVLPKAPPAVRAHIFLVLARTGGAPQSAAQSLYRDTVARAHLDPARIADLAWTLSLSGDAASARTLVSTLDAGAMVSATGAHWEGSPTSQESPIAVTAEVLNALVQLSSHDPFVPASARWLMLARQGTGWDCTRDSAQAVAALSAYAGTAHEGKAAYRYSVVVNGATKLTRSVTTGTIRQTGDVTVPVSSLHQKSSSTLDVTRLAEKGNMGMGPLYYVARLQYYLPAADIPARNEGIAISRRYLDRHGHVLTSVPTGTIVQVELTLRNAQSLVYLDVEDPIPAGLEPIDQSLNTSQQGIFPAWPATQLGPGIDNLAPYLNHTDLRDDHVALFAQTLPPGTYRYTYLAQATVAGSYGVAPTHASEAFFPEVFGRSAGQSFTVR